METYLKRTYRQRQAKKLQTSQAEEKNYPFWDYRSRRGSLSTSGNSGTSSSGNSSSLDGCSLSSVSSIRSSEETSSVNSSVSSTESEGIMVTSDPQRLQMQFMVDAHEVLPLVDLYQPLINWIDTDLRVFKVNEKSYDVDSDGPSHVQSTTGSRLPSLAVMLFLGEDEPVGYERIQTAKRRFEKPPWKFHHTEQVGQGKINLYPYNSSDYFYTSEELPLWAVRLVHCGKELIRMVLFTSHECWEDMVRLYRLIIGFEPDVCKNDFCLFTVHSNGGYDVQFALKKLKGETTPRVLESVKLQFRVPEVGNLVPLFPNICKPVSDRMWETHDHDGNTIVIEVMGKPRPTSSTPDRKVVPSRTSRNSSRSSGTSHMSVQSLASMPSSLSSSTSSSITSVSSATSDSTDIRTKVCSPPELPPRVPKKPKVLPPTPPSLPEKLLPPKLPERPKQCLASLKGFYV